MLNKMRRVEGENYLDGKVVHGGEDGRGERRRSSLTKSGEEELCTPHPGPLFLGRVKRIVGLIPPLMQ